jgi:hypothetical protein
MGRIPVIVVLVAASLVFVGAVALAQEDGGQYGTTAAAQYADHRAPEATWNGTRVVRDGAQSLVVIVLIAGMQQYPGGSVVENLGSNGFFVALFVGSACLFRNAARGGPERGAV